MAPTNAGNDPAHTSSQRPAVGRTPWDAIVEVSKTLGNLVPILIVAAGIVFAFFKFQDLSQARDRAVQEATEKARQALQKTYDQMVDLSGKQIQNVQALLGLHDEVSKSVKKFQADANQEMEKATQAQREADQAKQEAERAQREADQAKQEAERARQEADQVKQQVASIRAENTIRIWKVGSPHEGDIPERIIPPALLPMAQALGYYVEMETFPAKGFAKRFFDARTSHNEPEILAIDNYGIIDGITTDLGNFEGIGSSEEVRRSLVSIQGFFKSLEGDRGGWQFLISTSRNYQKSRQMVKKQLTIALKCDPDPIENTADINKTTIREIEQIALYVNSAYFHMNVEELDKLSDGKYSDASLRVSRVSDRESEILNTKICGLWGNDRLAFVYSSVAFESDEDFGQVPILAVFQKVDRLWNLLSLSDAGYIVKELSQSVPKLLDKNTGEPIQKPILIKPLDNAQFQRFPSLPEIEFTSSGSNVSIYLIEGQIRNSGPNSDWWGNAFKLIPPGTTDQKTIKEEFPFRVGKQPHRWRIWAIGGTGEALISDWRVINYLN